MKPWDIVAWTYNAGTHCPTCAKLAGMTAEGAGDTEENEPHPIYAGDEWTIAEEMDGPPTHCATCGEPFGE